MSDNLTVCYFTPTVRTSYWYERKFTTWINDVVPSNSGVGSGASRILSISPAASRNLP